MCAFVFFFSNLLYDSDQHVIEEVGDFFTWVDMEVKKMLAAIDALVGEPGGKSPSSESSTTESDEKTLLYCLQVLLPTIATLCHQFQAGDAPGKDSYTQTRCTVRSKIFVSQIFV